jgi:integrase
LIFKQTQTQGWFDEFPAYRTCKMPFNSLRMGCRAGCSKSGKKLLDLSAPPLLEAGTGLRYTQSHLGHSSSKTTEIYAHTALGAFHKIKNPLDGLGD